MVKLLIYSFIIVVLGIINVNAQKVPFTIERLNTDYAGIVTNGVSVLCYGNYGIITYTTDDGSTWSQKTIGDKHNIKKIISLNGTYYGMSNHALFISHNNANDWKFIPLSNSIDADIYNDSIYILTDKEILKADLSGKILNKSVINLDGSVTYTEMVVHKGMIYCLADKRYVLRYSLSTGMLTKTDVINMVNPSCFNCTHLTRMRKSNNEVFLIIYQNQAGESVPYQYGYTADNGNTWKAFTSMSGTGDHSAYTFDDSTMYIVGARELRVKYLNGFSTDCQRISFTKQEHLTIDDTIPDRTISYKTQNFKRAQEFTGLIKLHDTILVAVGTNKLITRSTNGGKKWNTISYFLYNSTTLEYVHCPNGNIIYVLGDNARSIYHTTNGGVTWLPQKYNGYPQTVNHQYSATHFDTKGNGFIIYTTLNSQDSNVLVTHDFGETFTPNYNMELYHTLDTTILSLPIFSWQYKQAMDIGGEYVIAGVKRNRTTSGDKLLPYNYILRFDSSFRFIDSSIVKANTVLHLTKIKNGDLYALCMNTSGPTVSDSLSGLDAYQFSCFMLRSKDKGLTWDSIPTTVPVPRLTLKLGNKYYIVNSVNSNSCISNENIVYLLGSQSLLRFNITTNTFDTIQNSTRYNTNKGGMFSIDSTLYVTSLYQTLYTTSKIYNKEVEWDSILSSQLFEQWIPSQNVPNEENTDVIVGTISVNDTIGIMLTTITSKNYLNSSVNLARLKKIQFPTSVENQIEETEYLWNSPPYPIPTTNQISTQIYWENGFSIKDIKFQIYDVLGNTVTEPKISFEQTQPFSGILRWNCEEIPKGIYIIRVYISKKSRLIPIIKL